MKNTFTTAREQFLVKYPDESAKLNELIDRATKDDFVTRLKDKKIVVEVESFTNIEEVKRYKIDYSTNATAELEALYRKINEQRRTMFYPYYSELITIVDRYLKEQGIKLYSVDNGVILRFKDHQKSEGYVYSRTQYNRCLNRIIDLIAEANSVPQCSYSESPKSSPRCVCCNHTSCPHNPHLIQCVWDIMDEKEHKRVMTKLDPLNKEKLVNALRTEDEE